MTGPQISLVTPSSNQGTFISQTIGSVLAQRGVECQYIVVDGGSSDGTSEVLDSFRGEIDVIISEPDRGQADALVKGFAYATAPIVGYLNSDDYLLPGALQLVLEHFERQPEVDAWYSHRIFVDEFDHLLRYWYLPPHSNYINLRWDFIPQETCFWRRTAMEAVGGIDRRLDFAMDYDLFVRMMRAGCRFRRLDDFLAVFREHDASKTVCHMETVGAREVNVVQQANRVSIHWYDRLVAAAFYSWLQLRSARLKRRLPLGPDAFIRRKA